MIDPEREDPMDKLKNLSDQEVEAAMSGTEEETEGTDDAAAEDADVIADSSTATEEETETVEADEVPKEFGKHPRWQKILSDRDEARKRVLEIEGENQRVKSEVAEIRRKAESLAYLEQMDSYARANPDAMQRAEELYRLATELPSDTKAGGDPVAAKVLMLERKLQQQEQARQQDVEQARNQQRWLSEVAEVNHVLTKNKVALEDQAVIGELIHSKYMASRARGANVTIERVGQDILGFLQGREAREKIKPKAPAKTAAATPTIRTPGGRVTISSEPDRERKQELTRDKATGRVDVGATLMRASKKGDELLRQLRTGKP